MPTRKKIPFPSIDGPYFPFALGILMGYIHNVRIKKQLNDEGITTEQIEAIKLAMEPLINLYYKK